MTAVPFPDDKPRTEWRKLLFLVFVFLGLISAVVTVARAKINCSDEFVTGGVTLMTFGKSVGTTGRRQCQVELDKYRFTVPLWAAAALSQSGPDR